MKKEEVADLSLEDSDKFTSKTNRSEFQTTLLFNLVGKNLNKPVAVEERVKNNHLHYCPGDKEEVKKVLKMGQGSYWFNMQEFKQPRFKKLKTWANQLLNWQ